MMGTHPGTHSGHGAENRSRVLGDGVADDESDNPAGVVRFVPQGVGHDLNNTT